MPPPPFLPPPHPHTTQQGTASMQMGTCSNVMSQDFSDAPFTTILTNGKGFMEDPTTRCAFFVVSCCVLCVAVRVLVCPHLCGLPQASYSHFPFNTTTHNNQQQAACGESVCHQGAAGQTLQGARDTRWVQQWFDCAVVCALNSELFVFVSK